MSKPVKNLMTEEYKKAYAEVTSACVVSVIGLDAQATNRLRGELRSKDIQIKVVKNSLARRAFLDGPLGPLGDALDGPCAVVTGGASIIDVAKLLAKAKKELPSERQNLTMAGYRTDLMRSALAALLVLYTEPKRTTCPNCECPLDDHNPKCLVDRLLKSTL